MSPVSLAELGLWGQERELLSSSQGACFLSSKAQLGSEGTGNR